MRQAHRQPGDAPRWPRWVTLGICLVFLPGGGWPLPPAERSIDEAGIRLELGEERSLLVLPVTNRGATSGARLRIETLTPEGEARLSLERDFTLEEGERPLTVELPARLGQPEGTPQNELLLDRLRFQLTTDDGWVAGGVRALSAVVELFELRVTVPETAPGGSQVAVHVLARRVSGGEPLEGVAVEARLSGEGEIASDSGPTSAAGQTTLALRLPGDLVHTEREIRVRGRLGGLTASAVSRIWTRPKLRVLVTTDKPLYQPGQPVRVRLLAIYPREGVAADLPLRVILRAPDGESVLERALSTSRHGVASLEWAIPERAPLGHYRLLVRGADGEDPWARRSVRVSRYELPAFRLEARSEAPFHLPGQRRAQVIVRAETLTGEPLEGARVTVRERFGEASVDGETNAAGEAALTVDLRAAHRELRRARWRQFADLGYEAQVVDPVSGRSEARRFDVRITRHPVHVYWQPARGTLPASLGVDGFVATFSADGTPVAGDVRFSGTFKARVRTNERGLARVRTERPPGEDARDELRIEARDDQGGRGRFEEDVYIDDDPVVRLQTATALLRPNDPLRIRVQADPPTEVLLRLQRGDDPNTTRQVAADAHGVWVEFPYQEGWVGPLCVGAVRSDDEKGYGADSLCVFYPGTGAPELSLEVRPERARPGERVRARLRLSDRRGHPRPGVVGLVGVDQSLLDRARSDEEFGGSWHSRGLWDDDPIGGLGLDALDPGQSWEPGLDVAAAWGLRNGGVDLRPTRSPGPDLGRAYRPVLERALAPAQEALKHKRWPDPGYPESLEALLEEVVTEGFAVQELLDPWGRGYRFSLRPGRERMRFEATSAGPDERFHGRDDLTVTIRSWPLYTRLAKKLRRALKEYVDTRGSMPRDLRALRGELRRVGVDPASLEDAHGERLRLELEREGRHGVLSGASRRASFAVKLDLYAEAEPRVREALAAFVSEAGALPQDEEMFWKALAEAGVEATSIHDPWGHAPWPVFRLESRHADVLGLRSAETDAAGRARRRPVSQDVEAIELRGAGPDGKRATRDDVHLATFARLAGELSPSRTRPRRGAVVSDTTGAILGQVTDPEGGRLPGATVILTRIDGDLDLETVTDRNGEYVIGALPEGRYRVRVALAGFRTVEARVRVKAGQLAAVDVELDVAEMEEAVTVSAEVAPTATSGAVAPAEDPSQSLRPRATPRLREYFPETLLWEPEVEIGPDGEAEVVFTLADSLTTWKLNALASTGDGFVAWDETDVVGFLPFFGELDPPPVLTDGDRLELPLVVRNQLPTEQRAEVSLEAGAGLGVGPGSATHVQVPPGGTAVASFPVHAEAPVADVALTAAVVGGESGDRIRKRLRVRPDGEDVESVQADLLSGDAALSFEVPPEALPGTAWAELRILSGLRSQIVEAIEGARRRPYGCAEQTISAGFPSLLFLELVGEEAQGPRVEKARRHLRRAVERLEAFRATGGGFGYWWGSEADTAVTAHALRLLVRAQGLVEVPERLVASSRELLLKRQGSDGRWGDSWPLTAVVARALAEPSSPGREETEAALARARTALRAEVAGSQEPYVLATAALLGRELDDGELLEPARSRLRVLEHREAEGSFWHLQANTPFFGWGRAGRLETTGLVAQVLVASRQPEDEALSERALLFLLRHQDSYGVWWSSQATVNVLEALAARARQEPASVPPSSPVTVRLDENEVASLEWDEEGDPARTISMGSLAAGRHRIELSGLPSGSSIVRLVTGHARPWTQSASGTSPSGKLRLSVDYDRTELRRLGWVTTQVEARRVGFRGYGMMLAEVGLPPGADVERKSLEDQLWRSGLCRYEIRPDRVVLYLWPRGGHTQLELRFRPRLALDARSAPSQLYDYYNPDELVRLPPARFKVGP